MLAAQRIEVDPLTLLLNNGCQQPRELIHRPRIRAKSSWWLLNN